MKLLQFIVFHAIAMQAYTQTTTTTKDIILNKILASMNDCAWNISDEPTDITFQLIDSMDFEPWINPDTPSPRWRWKQDTIAVSLQFEKGWTEERFSKAYSKNSLILNALISKAHRLHDPKNHWNLIEDWTSFNGYEVSFFRWGADMTIAEKNSLKELQRLPDVLLNGTGIFVSLSYEYRAQHVTERQIYVQVESLLKLLSFDVLKSKQFICGDEQYKPSRRQVREIVCER